MSRQATPVTFFWVEMKSVLNGLLAVNKPKGPTSRDVVNRAQHEIEKAWAAYSGIEISKKKNWKERLKIGHGGTLDPMASGVLVLGIGTGCKDLQQFLGCTKEYEVTALFGSATDTYDAEGKVTEVGPVNHLTEEMIKEALGDFRGDVMQVPPIYSAIKVAGKSLYEYARTNTPLPSSHTNAPRSVHISSLRLLSFNPPGPHGSPAMTLAVACGGGTYMRSLVHDLGIRLGTRAHMSALIREKQGLAVLGRDTIEVEELEYWERVEWAMGRMLK